MERQALVGGIARLGVKREAKAMADHAQMGPWVVCIGRVRALHEGKSAGKRRPVVLLFEHPDDPGVWAVMGLTTKATYEDGGRRIPIADWQRMGLHGPGYLWGGRAAFLPLHDLHGVQGEAGPEDRANIARFLCDPRIDVDA